jgi:hypothetical protein
VALAERRLEKLRSAAFLLRLSERGPCAAAAPRVGSAAVQKGGVRRRRVRRLWGRPRGAAGGKRLAVVPLPLLSLLLAPLPEYRRLFVLQPPRLGDHSRRAPRVGRSPLLHFAAAAAASVRGGRATVVALRQLASGSPTSARALSAAGRDDRGLQQLDLLRQAGGLPLAVTALLEPGS